LGISPSPILASDFDLLGQLRVDDPSVPSPPGLGSNVFKDRGALERSDFLGPFASLVNPVDNDAALRDRNSLINKVRLVARPLPFFTIQLNDGGLGVDDATVKAEKFAIQRTVGNVTTNLVPGVDYLLAYDNTNKIATLFPTQGVWTNGVYTITLDNSAQAIKDQAGNNLQPNEASGVTQFVVELAATAVSSWQNPRNRYDVDDNGMVAGLDVLLIINRLLPPGQIGPLPAVPVVPPYIDVSGNGSLEPLDALQVINFLNTPGGLATFAASGGGGVSAGPAVTSAASFAAPTAQPAASPSTAAASATASASSTSSSATDGSAVSFSLSVAASPVASSSFAGGSVDVSTGSKAQSASSSAATTPALDQVAASDDVWASEEWDPLDEARDSAVDELFEDSDEHTLALT
jgi:hypothetical protein